MHSVDGAGVEAVFDEFGSELLRSPEIPTLFAGKLRVYVGLMQ